MRSLRRGNLLLRNPLARGECAVRILFYFMVLNYMAPMLFDGCFHGILFGIDLFNIF